MKTSLSLIPCLTLAAGLFLCCGGFRFGGLILNHIVSAIDAAFTANAHNKTLYSEELSWYDRLHFDSYVSIFNGLDVGVQASWGF